MPSLGCPDCVSGTLHGGTPTGTVGTLHGLPTYIAEPPSGQPVKAIVVIIPDAFGWDLTNNRILADNYASKGGFRVLLPDFMNGHWAAAEVLESMEGAMNAKASIVSRIACGFSAAASFIPFLIWNRYSVTGPRVYNFFTALRASTELRIGTAGFCWGGKHVFYLSSDGAAAKKTTALAKGGLIDAAYTAHPSQLTFPADVEAVKTPMSVANGTKDIQMNEEQTREAKRILEAPEKGGKHEVVIYDGAKHGFAVRGDPSDETQKKQGIEAEDQAVAWFTKWLIV